MESSFGAKLLNGAIAGSVGTCCIFPLDLAKTRLQDQRTVAKGVGQVSRLYKNVFHCMFTVARTEGIRGLYKGLGVNVLLVNPEKAIKLAVNDQMRTYFGARKGLLPLKYEMLAGGVAGFCQIAVTTPMEFLKIQMQVAGRNSSQTSDKIPGQPPNNQSSRVGIRGYGTATLPAGMAASEAPRGAFDVARSLFKERGIGGVYKGLGATLARDVPFSCIYFPFFAFLNVQGYGPNGEKPHPVHSLMSGCFAGMTAALAVNPLDVIKTRLQVLKRAEGEPIYNGIVDCALRIYRQEGVAAFYKGAVPRMIVIAPLFGIAQMVYFVGVAETLMDTIRG